MRYLKRIEEKIIKQKETVAQEKELADKLASEIELVKKEIAEGELDVPYVPSAQTRLETIIKMADPQKGDWAADLGCGDGRVLIALAKRGAMAHGFELERSRVELARANIEKVKLSNRAFVYHQNFWEVDLLPFNIITLYGITSVMQRLEAKLKRELQPGSRVVSNYFTFPNWKVVLEENDVYLYIKE